LVYRIATAVYKRFRFTILFAQFATFCLWFGVTRLKRCCFARVHDLNRSKAFIIKEMQKKLQEQQLIIEGKNK
jgi:hypothetical protein